eukprot:m.541908 g.541908  ORF g.541908 m.541908 type:complete len:405 (-) comp57655_c0_seq2:100-1314(-)
MGDSVSAVALPKSLQVGIPLPSVPSRTPTTTPRWTKFDAISLLPPSTFSGTRMASIIARKRTSKPHPRTPLALQHSLMSVALPEELASSKVRGGAWVIRPQHPDILGRKAPPPSRPAAPPTADASSSGPVRSSSTGVASTTVQKSQSDSARSSQREKRPRSATIQPEIVLDEDEETVESSSRPTCVEEQPGKRLKGDPTIHWPVRYGGILLYRDDLDTLRGTNWLNDQVINAFLMLIAQRSQGSDAPRFRVAALSTFFYTKLCQSATRGVLRWFKKIPLHEFDLVLVPIHGRSHWTLLACYPQAHELIYCNSLDSRNADIRIVEHCLQEVEVHQGVVSAPSWTIVRRPVSKQANSHDCGVFVCRFAERLSRQQTLVFPSSDMQQYRKAMTQDLLSHQLMLTTRL